MLEVIPAVEGRFRPLAGTQGGIMSVTVEIDAVVPGVGVDPVQHHPDAQGAGGFAQLGQVLVAAQDRVYLQIVRGIIAVVGAGLENRIQINHGNAQFL